MTDQPRALRYPALAVAGLLAAAALGACSSGSHAGAAGASRLQQDCTAVSDVLSDGPDPDVDPVGYAQAQVIPLRQLKIAEPNLRSVVTELADAYAGYSSAGGASQNKYAVQTSQDETALNAVCPGAAP